jgi:uncharacterized phage protein gp47/JayE
MAVLFDPDTGLTVESAETVLSAISADWQSAFSGGGLPPLDVDPATPAGQLIATQAALVQAKDSEILYLANMFNPKTSVGRWQDALGAIYFMERKRAEPTVVTCTCTGLYNTVIPAGAIVQNVDGYQLAAIDTTTLPASGTADIEFETIDTGAIPIAAGTVTKIITVIPGWDAVINANAGALGRDEETQLEFETRRYASVAVNAHGSVLAIQGAIAAVDGVLDCAVLENTTDTPQTIKGVSVDAHSICASVFGGDGTDIAEAIYRRKDAGCGTTGNTSVSYVDPDFNNATYIYDILRPTPTAVSMTVTIIQTDATPNTIADSIKSALIADFYGQGDNPRVGMATTLYASRFYPAVINAGASDFVSLQIALGGGALSSYIDIDADVEPTLDESDITVVIL